MDRVPAFVTLGPPADPALDRPLRYALVQCLDPEEVCRAVDLTFEQPYFERRRLLNRMVRDLSAGPLPCHSTLFDKMFSRYADLPHAKRQSCASALFVLADAWPILGRRRLVELILASPSVSMRRQAFKSLRSACDSECGQLAETAWAKYHDPEAFELLLTLMPLDWLRREVDRAFVPGVRGRILARATIRLAPSDPQILDRLFDISPVSWAYATAKLSGPADRRRLRHAFDVAESDDDKSLVVWAIGQLKDWDLLLELHKVPGPTLEEILAKHGISPGLSNEPLQPTSGANTAD